MTVKYNFKTKPYSHQQIAMDLAGQRDAFGFFMEMGTGKSKVLIDNIGTLHQRGELNFAWSSHLKACIVTGLQKNYQSICQTK